MMNYQDLGARVKRLRRELNITQEQLAEKVGISTSFLGHIERGTRVASLETFVALCNTLNVSADYLLQGSILSDASGTPADDMNPVERARLEEFLRMAQDAVRGWDR